MRYRTTQFVRRRPRSLSMILSSTVVHECQDISDVNITTSLWAPMALGFCNTVSQDLSSVPPMATSCWNQKSFNCIEVNGKTPHFCKSSQAFTTYSFDNQFHFRRVSYESDVKWNGASSDFSFQKKKTGNLIKIVRFVGSIQSCKGSMKLLQCG